MLSEEDGPAIFDEPENADGGFLLKLVQKPQSAILSSTSSHCLPCENPSPSHYDPAIAEVGPVIPFPRWPTPEGRPFFVPPPQQPSSSFSHPTRPWLLPGPLKLPHLYQLADDDASSCKKSFSVSPWSSVTTSMRDLHSSHFGRAIPKSEGRSQGTTQLDHAPGAEGFYNAKYKNRPIWKRRNNKTQRQSMDVKVEKGKVESKVENGLIRSHLCNGFASADNQSDHSTVATHRSGTQTNTEESFDHLQLQRILEEYSEKHKDGGLMLSDELVERLMDDVTPTKREEYKSNVFRELQVSQVKGRRRVVPCRQDIDTFTPAFLLIYESLIPAEEEKVKHMQLLVLLQKVINREWPDAELVLYGSCANSFGVADSDIDVCLKIDDACMGKKGIVLKLAQLLESDNFQNVQALTGARVPVVKLMDPVTGLSCDICINNTLAVVNTRLLRDYAHIDTRLRQLAFLVKHWAKAREVNETYHGTLSSYAYVLMCINFLQLRVPPILPCLQEMEETFVEIAENVRCAYYDQVQRLHEYGLSNKESIAKLLWGFFDYWAFCHDYVNDVISVRRGKILSKQSKDWTKRIGNDRHLICIEDPFEVEHDLGRVVDRRSIRVLRDEFVRAAKIMQEDPHPDVTLFEMYVPLEQRSSAEKLSQLSM